MIGRITGVLLEKHPPQVLVDVQGVAYEVDVPMSTFYQLPASGGRITLHTHLVVREDAHLLFGFATEGERQTLLPRFLRKAPGVEHAGGADAIGYAAPRRDGGRADEDRFPYAVQMHIVGVGEDP